MSEATATSTDTRTDGETTDTLSAELSSPKDKSGSADDLTLDTIFEALKNERRRRVLQYLERADGSLELGTVAERIAADENDKSEAEISYSERKRVYIALYQCHLPKLDDMGVISFDKSRGTLTRESAADELKPYLNQRVSSHPWHLYYGGIIGAGLAVVLINGLTGLLAPLTTQVTMLVVLAAVAVCAIFHAWSVR